MNRKKRTCCHVIPERRRTGRPVKSRKTFEINWNCNTRTRHHHHHHTAPMGSGGTAFKHAQSTSTRSRSFIPPPLKRGCRWRWQRRWNIKSYFMFLNPKNTQRTNCFYGRHVYAVVVHSPSICRSSLYLKVYDGSFFGLWFAKIFTSSYRIEWLRSCHYCCCCCCCYVTVAVLYRVV